MTRSDFTFVLSPLLPSSYRPSLHKPPRIATRGPFAPTRASAAANPAKTALITGASTGIGAQTALRLPAVLPRLEHLVLAARDTPRVEAVAAAVRAAFGIRVDMVPLELGRVAAVRESAEMAGEVLGGEPLDLLVNNAGVMACPMMFSDDGVELQYAVNHLGAAALTLALLPALRASKTGARVVSVSSMAVAISRGRAAPPLPAEKLRGTIDEAAYGKWPCYGDSKLAMSLFTRALAAREEAAGLTALSLHPGVVQTELGRYVAPKWMEGLAGSSGMVRGLSQRVFRLLGLLTPEEGAMMSLELAGCGKEAIENGAFYVGLGMRKGDEKVIPLLGSRSACDEVFDATVKFLDTI